MVSSQRTAQDCSMSFVMGGCWISDRERLKVQADKTIVLSQDGPQLLLHAGGPCVR